MIIFLTLLYCGFLYLLVRLNVIKLTLFWKISPALWMVLLLILLFIPMQWGAPAGPINVYKRVVEVVPNVSGEVIEVPATGLTDLKKGDVLFQIDPVPFQLLVNQLQAQLEDAIQNAKRLAESAEAARQEVLKSEANVDVLKSEQRAAAAALEAAQASLQEARGKKVKAVAAVNDLTTQVAASQREYDRIEKLVKTNATAKSELDKTEIQLTNFRSSLTAAELDVKVADDTIAKYEANVGAAQAGTVSADLHLKQHVETELPRVRALAREAKLAAESKIGDEHTTVASIRAQLEKAKFDLDQATVRAPSDGYVIGATLQPGQRVANLPLRAWMSFVPKSDLFIGVGIPQYALRHIENGQRVELTLKMFPGRIFEATVDEIAYMTTQGQLQPSGVVMTAPGVDQSAVPIGVRLKLNEAAGLDVASLPGGAVGTAAIYTDKSKMSHVIRRVMIRMEAWMNYLIPW